MIQRDQLDESLKEYRSHLILAEQKAQEDYDKTVVFLSGGALGISFAFVKDFIGTGPMVSQNWLIWAWICWGTSVTAVLASYFMSQQALRKAIRQVDTGEIYAERPGGWYDIVTAGLNAVGGILFVVGVIILAWFVKLNIGD